MYSPIDEVTQGNQGAMMVLSEHQDLTELCRAKEIVGSLVWVVYKDLAKEDAQTMKELLFKDDYDFSQIVHRNSNANAAFNYKQHKFGSAFTETKQENDKQEPE